MGTVELTGDHVMKCASSTLSLLPTWDATRCGIRFNISNVLCIPQVLLKTTPEQLPRFMPTMLEVQPILRHIRNLPPGVRSGLLFSHKMNSCNITCSTHISNTRPQVLLCLGSTMHIPNGLWTGFVLCCRSYWKCTANLPGCECESFLFTFLIFESTYLYISQRLT